MLFRSASYVVNDTSFKPVPTYTVTPSLAAVNEGSPITTTVKTTNVPTGTVLYWALSGTGITAGAGFLKAGSVVTFTVNTSENVTISGGTPTLSLSSGGSASYTGGSGTTALTFSYTVGATDNTSDLTITALNANTATLIDAAGNTFATFANNPAGTLVIDTIAPAAPTLALGTGVANGATAAEATQGTGVVTVSGESGAIISVTFSRTGGGSVTKTVTGSGSAQAVTLAAGDLNTLGDGSISVSATQTDAAGNAQTAAAATTSFTLDTVAPAAPGLALAADTGLSSTDRLTNNSTINVSSLESGASWQYSTDSGTSWSAGTGSSFSVAAGTYSLGQVQVRQTDQAGNLGPANIAFAAFTVDTLAPSVTKIGRAHV